ncbi:MAG: hypothetical protein IJH78_00315 [Clostridia bacterium]|nr:hypothetical protein [Clostridia bacterium]
MRQYGRMLAVLLAALLAVASLGVSALAEGGDGYVIIGQASEVANLNPMLYPRTPDSNVQCLIFDFLVKPDEELNFIPDLAESWDISEDGKVYTFYLRQDVKWHDGEAFTADDVVFTLNALANPEYIGGNENRVLGIVGAAEVQAGEAETISGVKKVDDYTVEITLPDANAAFMADMYTAILPEHVLAGENPGEWSTDDFNRAPVGTGKYKFVEWKSGQYIMLERNEDYFGDKPSIKDVVVQFGSETTLVAALLNNEIDVLYNLPTAEVENVEAVDSVYVYTNEQMTVYYIGFNLLDETLSDLRVRQALAHGLDKQTVLDTVYGNGLAYVADDIFPSNHWSHSENVTVYEYNPEKAKSLLEEAGYVMNESTGIYEKDGKPLHLVYDMSASATGEAMATLFQQQWKEIGVELEIVTQDFATLAFTKLLPDSGAKETTADSYQMYTLGFGVEVDPNEYNEYFSTNTGAGSWNFGHYSNPEVDELFKLQLTQTDPEERAATFHKIGEIESNDLYWIPTYSNYLTTGVSTRVKDFIADYRGVTFQIEKWNVD